MTVTRLLAQVVLLSGAICLLGCATAPATVFYEEKSAQKICQLTGDQDNGHTLPIPTGNQTETRANLVGTDLGTSFRGPFGGIFFLFGDSVPTNEHTRASGSDAVAYTTDADPEDCVALTFMLADDGIFKSPVLVERRRPYFSPPYFPEFEFRIPLGIFEVPTGGFFWNGTAYVTFQTNGGNDSDENYRPHRSVMASNAKLVSGDLTFTRLFDFDPDKFMNISSVLVDDSFEPAPALSTTSDERVPTKVLFFGTGLFRAGDAAHLATADLVDIDAGKLKYFQGYAGEVSTRDNWSDESSNADALFRQSGPGCMGEISVTRNPYIGKWLAIYSCDNPRGINFRVADKPWGPWSEPAMLFDPRKDGGYCNFMHDMEPDKNCPSGSANPYDNLVERKFGQDNYGGEYGAYVIDAYTTGSMNDHTTTIYFTMSTWNPYQVVLMKSTLVRPGPIRQLQHILVKWFDSIDKAVRR